MKIYSADTWNNINLLLRKTKRKTTLPQTMKVDGQIISSPQKICNQMNQHFATIGEKLTAKSTNPAQNYSHFKFLGKCNSSTIVLQPTMYMRS